MLSVVPGPRGSRLWSKAGKEIPEGSDHTSLSSWQSVLWYCAFHGRPNEVSSSVPNCDFALRGPNEFLAVLVDTHCSPLTIQAAVG